MSSLTVTAAQVYLNLARGQDVLGFQPDLALYLDDPRVGGVEVSGGGYVRQPIVFAAPSGQTMVNSNTITFPVPSADYPGPITHAAILNGATVWEVVAIVATEEDRTVLAGSAPVAFASGSILVRRT